MEEKINHIVIVGDNNVINKQKTSLKNINDSSIETLGFPGSLAELVNKNILLILNLTDNAEKELEELDDIHHKNAAIIVIGDKQNAQLLSIAISADISAFLDTNYKSNELEDTIHKILFKRSNTNRKSTFSMFINAKGGAGSSFISSNIAYILSHTKYSEVALVDMDLQFGSIGLNFNINAPKYTIIDALNEVDELDRISLAGYMEKYNDSLSLILPSIHDIVIPGEVKPQALEKLLMLIQNNYDHLIIDVPRIIDPLSMMIMDKADNIIIVLQQNLAQFRDGRRLIYILNKDLEIDLDRIIIIINRYDKNNTLKKSDMVKLVGHNRVYTITNDFDLVVSTSNLGIPLCEHAENSKVAKDLKIISYALGNIQETKKKKFLGLF
jgi:pilus assembly protein CpaE